MKLLIGFVSLCLCITGLAGEASAQEDVLVMEGCVTPGSRPGILILTEDTTGLAVTITNRSELAGHASNHRERVRGRYSDEDPDLFVVERSEHLSDDCRPVYERVTERVEELVDDLRRNAALGFRVGTGIDPEIMLIGAHAEFATGVDGLLFRPNIEFGLGEVTSEYALNVEGVYRIPFTRESRGALEVWHLYVGGGPSVSVFNQEFRERDYNEVSSRADDELFTFDDRDTELGFNVLVGIMRQNGFFAEVKAGAYGNPAVRMLLGFTF